MLKCELHHVEVCLLEGTDMQHATDIATAMQSLGQTRLMTGQEHSDLGSGDPRTLSKTCRHQTRQMVAWHVRRLHNAA